MRRVATILGGVLAVVALLIIVTNRWGDEALYPDRWGRPVEIYVISHGYHSGLALPTDVLSRQVSQATGGARPSAVGKVAARFMAYPWIEVGWGEARFYRQVPTIDDLDLSLALSALFRPGNESVLHLVGLPGAPRDAFPAADIERLELSQDGFGQLVAQLEAAFARTDQGAPEELGPGLYGPSLFYRGTGSFHLFSVCNHWTARLLSAAGVPTSPLLATLPAGLLFVLRHRPAIRLPDFRAWRA